MSGASSDIGTAAAGALNAMGVLVQPEHVAISEVLLGPATSRCEKFSNERTAS